MSAKYQSHQPSKKSMTPAQYLTQSSIKTSNSHEDTQRNILLKMKRFELDLSLFKLKPACFILHSVGSNRKFPEKETKEVHFEMPDLEKEGYKGLFEFAATSRETPQGMSVVRFKEYLKHPYVVYKEMAVDAHANKPKRNVLIRMKEMFDDFRYDSSVVYAVGPASKNGGLIIDSKDFGEEELFLADVAAEWKKRTSKQKHLLIILEMNYAGRWAKDHAGLKLTDVSVWAACGEKERAFSTPIGGIFTHNILKYLNKSQSENLMMVEPTPVFAGDYLKCKMFTNFYINFPSWNAMSVVQKSDFMEITYENGRYIGYVHKAQKGFWGQFQWTNGLFKDCCYSGEFNNGHLHGKGVMMYKSGRVYEGDFLDNAPEGYGEETYENGDRYAGRYRRGFKSGQGVYTYANGDVYKGEFLENRPSGKGVLTMKNGSVYTGEFKNGRCNGKGVFKYKNGDVYEGEWVNSLKHGNGVYKYANGDVYEGQFVNGVRHGHGTMVAVNGETYIGEWALDAMSGSGEYKTEHSSTIGEWVKGTLTKQPTFFKKVGTKQIEAKLV